tara:strand:- start:8 stop:523 length:516 start_codon:yes stop_codon:yes gene_type:complete
MKQDIRDLFKEDNDLKTLPENHRTEFLKKLEKEPKKTTASFLWLKIAAVLLVALTVGLSIFYTKPATEEVSPIVAQIEAVEAEYLKNIETEWQNFVAIAEDEVLVERFRKKLKELDADYQDISIQFREDSDNILVIEALVDNLQNRLQILKNIQKHIKILNQNNEHYEKSI